MARRSAGYAQIGAGRCTAVANLGRRLPVELCLFLLAFRGDVTPREHELGSCKLRSTGLSRERMMLLIFAARPDSTVPICLDRYNFATGQFAASVPTSSAAEATARKAKGNRGLPSANELGKRWRFFPTYAEL